MVVIAHRCVQQHDSENDMCEYEYYSTNVVCAPEKCRAKRGKKM